MYKINITNKIFNKIFNFFIIYTKIFDKKIKIVIYFLKKTFLLKNINLKIFSLFLNNLKKSFIN